MNTLAVCSPFGFMSRSLYNEREFQCIELCSGISYPIQIKSGSDSIRTLYFWLYSVYRYTTSGVCGASFLQYLWKKSCVSVYFCWLLLLVVIVQDKSFITPFCQISGFRVALWASGESCDLALFLPFDFQFGFNAYWIQTLFDQNERKRNFNKNQAYSFA